MKQKAAFQLEKHGTRVVYRLTWGEVRRILGRDHANTAADDAKLARALRAAGARPLGKSYAKEDGWHAFAPKGTPMPALAKRRNPARAELSDSDQLLLDYATRLWFRHGWNNEEITSRGGIWRKGPQEIKIFATDRGTDVRVDGERFGAAPYPPDKMISLLREIEDAVVAPKADKDRPKARKRAKPSR